MQVPARLYVFDIVTHTWKERGHGEIRLNDATQIDGVFQSRLGWYYVLNFCGRGVNEFVCTTLQDI